MNRMRFKAGKYRPYFKWCALPFAIALAALGLTPEVSPAFRIFYASFMLIVCELTLSTMYMAAMAMLPYFARDDVARTKYVSFGNGSAILAFILVGTLMLPLADFFGGGDRSRGFALALALFAVVAAPLYYNAYFRLKERYYDDTPGKPPAMKDILLAIGRNRRFMLFLAGFCIYYMADSFKNLTTYYYMTYNMGRPDLAPVVIMAGLLSPLAVQPLIPRLLAYARKESLIVIGLFAASCVSLLMLTAGDRPVALIACVVFYGVCTAVVANLVFTVLASFTDEMRKQQNMNVSEILTATMGLSSNVGIAIASGAAPVVMAAFGYSALAVSQTAGALTGIKTLYILCTSAGMAIAGLVMLFFRNRSKQ